MPIDNRLDSLNLRFQPIAQAFLEIVKAYVLVIRWPGFKIRITETKRDDARQADVLADGASDVSWGWHNAGLAFDFVLIDDEGQIVKSASHPAYEACWKVGQALGCHCPITLKNGTIDGGHVEWHPGFSKEQYLAATAAGQNLPA